jgi:hypothetical protein
MQPGVWHATLWLDGVHQQIDKRDDAVRPGAHNKDRFGRLALLYGWCGAGDRQFVYEDDPPGLVHVVDMGHTRPGANAWTAAQLDGHAANRKSHPRCELRLALAMKR